VWALLFIPYFKAEPWEVPLPGGYSIPIQPFGVLVAIGVLLGARVAEEWGKRNGIQPAVVSDLIGHVVIAGFVGGYFLNAAFYKPEALVRVIEDPRRLVSEYLGLSSFGGFFGAIGGLVLWRVRRKMSLIAIGEAACFAFPFGWFFGRMGCFVAKDHPGRVTDFFLAIEGWPIGAPPYPTRHDLGLYEVLWSAAAAALFLVLAKKRRPRGFYMALLPLSYAPIRFFLDYLRATPEYGGDVRYGGFTPGQYGALVIFALGLYVAWWIRNHEEPTVVPPDLSDGTLEQVDSSHERAEQGASRTDGSPTEDADAS
jgi:phosphatidylglycerol:prolipoprotein diacylglycerol transferase